MWHYLYLIFIDVFFVTNLLGYVMFSATALQHYTVAIYTVQYCLYNYLYVYKLLNLVIIYSKLIKIK